MNRKVFFDGIRQSVFRGSLSQTQVDGVNSILDGWQEMGDGDQHKLAYVLATSYHETARTMQPIDEYGKGRGRRYGIRDRVTGKTYYGRGHVQLTWKDNYRKLSQVTGIDLVSDPDLALDSAVSVKILIVGMMDGLFTGKSLKDYIRPGAVDYVGARKIVNGTDRAQLIAGYASAFEEALEKAHTAQPLDHAPEPCKPETTGKPMIKSTTTISALVGAGTSAVAAVEGLADKSPYLAGLVILIAAGAAFWIIRERFMKSKVHGV